MVARVFAGHRASPRDAGDDEESITAETKRNRSNGRVAAGSGV